MWYIKSLLYIYIFSIDIESDGIYIQVIQEEISLELSRFFSQKRKETFRRTRSYATAFTRLSSIGMAFVSFVVPFVYFCIFSVFFLFLFFFYTCLHFVGPSTYNSFPFNCPRRIYVYVCLILCATSLYRRKTICLSSDERLEDKLWLCFVDWQRCTQVVIHVYENSEKEK